MTENKTEFWNQAAIQCAAEIAKATVPFYVVQEGKPYQNRSGVLFEYGGCFFILTAAHAIAELAAEGVGFFISPPEFDAPAIPLGGAKVVGTEQRIIDVAAVELSTEIADQLRPVRHFLSVSDLDFSETKADGFYLVLGYPFEMTTSDEASSTLSSYPLPYGTVPFSGTIPEEGYDQDTHILLGYRHDSYSFKSTPKRAPRVQGMSGCGIWRICDASAEEGSWNPSHRRLVAIQHRWAKQHGYVKGTWIKYVLALLRHHYPSVRPELDDAGVPPIPDIV